MDGAEPYRTSNHHPKSIEEDRSARIAGALAALKRGAAKAVARDLAAGLEPIVRKPKPKAEEPTDSV